MKLTEESYYGLGQVPIGIGAALKGWNVRDENFRDQSKLPVIDFRAMTSACSHDCYHCFTDKEMKTLTLDEIKDVIDQLAEMQTYAIDYLGEGEPTIDRDFFDIIEYTSLKGIQPVVFTDAALKMRDRKFVKRVYNSGASVLPKCDSLFNPDYQNWIVRDKTGKFFEQRNEALEILIEQGFNKVQEDGTTRLGFDMVISSKNIHEAEKHLRYCRENNLWIVFAMHLPAGRSGSEEFDKTLIPSKEQKKQLREMVKRVDQEYGFNHEIYNNFATAPCVEYMCIYGDGRVSPCVGNVTLIGNVREHTMKKINNRILKTFPCHDRNKFDGHCLYREKI